MSTGGMKSATVRASSAVYGRMVGKPNKRTICSGSFSNSRKGSQRVTFNMATSFPRCGLFSRSRFCAWCNRIDAFDSPGDGAIRRPLVDEALDTGAAVRADHDRVGSFSFRSLRDRLMEGSARDRPDFRGESVAFLRRQYHVERRVEQALFLTVVFLQNLVKRGSSLIRELRRVSNRPEDFAEQAEDLRMLLAHDFRRPRIREEAGTFFE